MQLPQDLQEAIERLSESCSLSALAEASQELSHRYRSLAKEQSYVRSSQDRLAYLLARLPATYAAISKVFEELLVRSPGFTPQSFLDLGAGPGTGLWAAAPYFPSLQKMTALERDKGFIDLGKKLISLSECADFQRVKWVEGDMEQQEAFPLCDLALASYAVGELREEVWEKLFTRLWDSVEKVLVILEPGTPVGYKRILKFRDFFIGKGAYIWAPCPHKEACPLGQGDWCHFSARVERSSIHRKTKAASLNYEDEKFSYLILGKQKSLNPGFRRILRHPQINKGHVSFTLCTTEGIKKETMSKKDKEKYKAAKKLDWGDSI